MVAPPFRGIGARLRGFKAYLTKPLDMMALLDCLDQHLAPTASGTPA